MLGPQFQVELWRRQGARDPGRHLDELALALARFAEPGVDEDEKLRLIGRAGTALINLCSAHSIPFSPLLRGPPAGPLTKQDALGLAGGTGPERGAIIRLAHALRDRARSMGADFEMLVPLVASAATPAG